MSVFSYRPYKEMRPEFYGVFHRLQTELTQENVCVCACVSVRVCVAQDLAQYVNEVKRDNETLREIDQYQRSIENLVNQKSFSTSISSC